MVTCIWKGRRERWQVFLAEITACANLESNPPPLKGLKGTSVVEGEEGGDGQ